MTGLCDPGERSRSRQESGHLATCEKCAGDGWQIDHSDECYEAGECVGCGGVQVECEACEGTGRVS